mmetsp:Transcript_1274/g.2662  ORF Transcript_1274/g.2662 Transcript_1274/m.2662 type:complete len:466 (-) Transcript_1274:25-1422(-)
MKTIALVAFAAFGAAEHESPRVAIVGAGVAGSATSWFLKNSGFDVTVFERGLVGGRVREIQFPTENPVSVEAGGAAIHSLNKYMASFIETLGLHRDDSAKSKESWLSAAASADGGIASWDGGTLRKVSPLDFPISLLRTRQLVKEVTGKWEMIYDLQKKNVSFAHPYDLLERVGVASLATKSARDWLSGRWLDSGFLERFVDGISRVNYGQDSSINAFADAVSLAGAGLVGSLYSVKEGNAQVMSGLLNASGAKLRQQHVKAVRESTSGYEVCTESSECESFASVVLATPLELAEIDLGSLQPSARRAYQTTVATFVLADGLKKSFFDLQGDIVDADTVVTTANSSIPFNSVAVHGVSGSRKVYKLFSEAVPSQELLDSLFANASAEIRQFVWKAYPVLTPRSPSQWPSFRLHGGDTGGLYYVNAMETAVSCMETEAVGAKNVALLVTQDLQRTRRDTSEEVVQI